MAAYEIAPEELASFKKRIFRLSGFNLEYYKSTQLDRRLLSMMERSNCQDLDTFYACLASSPSQLSAFLDNITINVSEFFRNPEKFQEFKQFILPKLVKEQRRLRIWSAGCSIGAEIYSLVMLMDQADLLERCYFMATDVDTGVLMRAKEGIFSPETLKNVPPAFLQQYFDPAAIDDKKGWFQFKENWRKKVHFFQHDLLVDPYPRFLDMIICRNVMIYFKEDAKNHAYAEFYASLKENGILFIGGTERVMHYHELGYEMLSPFFYQKPCTMRLSLE